MGFNGDLEGNVIERRCLGAPGHGIAGSTTKEGKDP
jgi:hypothetical protein